jgi:hypothetical protein
MQDYPAGARLLFWVSAKSGVGVQQLYCFWPFRLAMTLADKLEGRPSSRPK